MITIWRYEKGHPSQWTYRDVSLKSAALHLFLTSSIDVLFGLLASVMSVMSCWARLHHLLAYLQFWHDIVCIFLYPGHLCYSLQQFTVLSIRKPRCVALVGSLTGPVLLCSESLRSPEVQCQRPPVGQSWRSSRIYNQPQILLYQDRNKPRPVFSLTSLGPSCFSKCCIAGFTGCCVFSFGRRFADEDLDNVSSETATASSPSPGDHVGWEEWQPALPHIAQL